MEDTDMFEWPTLFLAAFGELFFLEDSIDQVKTVKLTTPIFNSGLSFQIKHAVSVKRGKTRSR